MEPRPRTLAIALLDAGKALQLDGAISLGAVDRNECETSHSFHMNKEEVFQRVLLRSLRTESSCLPHRSWARVSAAEAFNARGLHPRMQSQFWVHQDVYLPPGWTDRMEAILTTQPSALPVVLVQRLPVLPMCVCQSQPLSGLQYRQPARPS